MHREHSGRAPEHLALEARHCAQDRNVRLRLTPTSPRGESDTREALVSSDFAGVTLVPSTFWHSRCSRSQFRQMSGLSSHFTLRARQVTQPNEIALAQESMLALQDGAI